MKRLTLHIQVTSCVPADTTRPKKPHEKEAVEYHFVTKQQFDADALNNKYVYSNVARVVCVKYLFPAGVKVDSPQVHRARGIQGEPVRHQYRGDPLRASQE